MVAENPNLKEKKEVKEEKNKNIQSSLGKSLIEDFIEAKIDGNNPFKRNIKSFENISSENYEDYWKDYLMFIEYNVPNNLNEIKSNKESYFNLFKLLVKQSSVENKTLYSSVEKSFKKHFDFTTIDAKKIDVFNSALSQLSRTELFNLTYSINKQKTFLLNNGILKKDEIETKLSTNDDYLLDKIFTGFGADQIKEIKNNSLVFEGIKKLYLNSFIDFRELKSVVDKVIGIEGKRALVKYFLPEVSLKEAIDVGLIKKDEKEEIIKKYLVNELKYDSSEIDDILIRKLDLNLFFIDTGKLETLGKNINVFVEQENLFKIQSKINDIDYVQEDNNKIDTYKNLVEKIKNSSEINNEIKKNIYLFEKGNYIEIEKEENQEKTKTLFHIASHDEDGVNPVNLINVTRDNGRSKDNKGPIDTFNYNEIYELFKGYSSVANIKLKFLDSKEVKKDYPTEVPDEDNISTEKELQAFLDENDVEGKNVKLNEMAIKYKPNKPSGGLIDDEIFYVNKITSTGLILNDNPEEITFKDFALAFKERKASRFKQVKNSKELFEESLLKHEAFKGLIVDEDGKIKPQSEKGNKDYPGIEYLIGSHGETIKLEKLDDNSITIHTGKYTEGLEKDGKKSPDTFKSDIKITDNNYTLLYAYLDQEITKFKMTPKKVKSEVNEDNVIKNAQERKKKLNPFKSYLSLLSIGDILGGQKQFFDSIKSSFDTGGKLKSAKLALSLGGFLPKDIQNDLKSTVEGEQHKLMEAFMEKMRKSTNKDDFFATIERILATSNQSDPELEGALMATVGRFGVLYPGKLKAKRKDFLWYQALGGKVGDKIFMDYKKQCEDSQDNKSGKRSEPMPFTEEGLIEELLRLQEKDGNRRSNLRTKYGGYLKGEGIENAFKAGNLKTSGMSTFNSRMFFCQKCLEDGEYPEAVGAIDNVWGKSGGSIDTHNVIFCITVTGIANDMSTALLNRLVTSGKARDTPFNILHLNGNPNKVEIFQKAIRKIVLSLGNKDMLTAFDKIKKSPTAAYNFWNKYGKDVHDRMVLKDPYVYVNVTGKNPDPDLVNYYGKLTSNYNDGEYHVKKEFIDDGKINFDSGTPLGLVSDKIVKEIHVNPQTCTISSSNETGKIVLKAIFDQMDDLKELGDKYTRDEKFEVYFKLYSNLEPVIREGIGDVRNIENNKNSLFLKELSNHGIDIVNYSPKDSNYILDPKYKTFVSKQFDKFMKDEVDTIDKTEKKVRESFKDILNNNNVKK